MTNEELKQARHERYEREKQPWSEEQWTMFRNYQGDGKTQKETNEAKVLCRRTANYICAICGNEGIDAHHIIPINKETGERNNSQDNLICLCRPCHERVHNNVYIIDTNKNISFNNDYFFEVSEKPDYMEYYERTHGVTIKYTKNKIFAIKDFTMTPIRIKDMKEEYKHSSEYADICFKEIEEANKCHEKAKDIRFLKKLAQYYKSIGDKDKWHIYSHYSRNYIYAVGHETVDELRDLNIIEEDDC